MGVLSEILLIVFMLAIINIGTYLRWKGTVKKITIICIMIATNVLIVLAILKII